MEKFVKIQGLTPFLLLLTLLLVAPPAHAKKLGFFIVQPGGEGDTESALPYLTEFFAYLSEQTQVAVDGKYLNDTDEAVGVFKSKSVDLAIVSHAFYEKYKDEFKLKTILATVPSYSAGPYEKYHIMAHAGTHLNKLEANNVAHNLISSQNISQDFLNKKILGGDLRVSGRKWQIQHADNLLAEIRTVAAGTSSAFILLNGYEFSVINQLKQTRAEFRGLVLVYSSAELPSSKLVTVGEAAPIETITQALLTMSTNLKGSVALKNLRLKGFARVP